MTKKGIILTIILIILLIGIVVSTTMQSYKVNREVKKQVAENNKVDEFALDITDETGFDLEGLKSYELPIIIQIGSGLDEMCVDMRYALERLNRETRGKAIIKYLDTDKYEELWSESRVSIGQSPIQVLIDSNGQPYNTTLPEAFGFKIINDEEGNHVYTVHDGELSLNDMKSILIEMGI